MNSERYSTEDGGDIMQITSRFTIAVHMLTAIDCFKKPEQRTSAFLAGSIGVNPVIVRNVMGQLSVPARAEVA